MEFDDERDEATERARSYIGQLSPTSRAVEEVDSDWLDVHAGELAALDSLQRWLKPYAPLADVGS